MVRYSFPVGLSHSLFHAGLSRRTPRSSAAQVSLPCQFRSQHFKNRQPYHSKHLIDFAAPNPTTPSATLSAERAFMPTENQSAASRANAQHSTGPRTAEGKAASRFNALKHGI